MLRARKSQQNYKKYQKSHPTTACDFCNFNADEIIEQNDSVMVVRNKFPYELWDFGKVADHLMVMPKRHITSLADLTKAEKLDYMDVLGEWELKGYNVYARTDLNKIAKSIPHQHAHLIKTTGTRRKLVMYADKPYFLWHR